MFTYLRDSQLGVVSQMTDKLTTTTVRKTVNRRKSLPGHQEGRTCIAKLTYMQCQSRERERERESVCVCVCVYVCVCARARA